MNIGAAEIILILLVVAGCIVAAAVGMISDDPTDE